MKKIKIIEVRDNARSHKREHVEIIEALAYLKDEAARGGMEEITTILDCAFKLCRSVYRQEDVSSDAKKG
jgi:hypothetical protein